MTPKPAPTLATHPVLSEQLARYRSARAYFIPLAGNNGDKLIELGSRHALAAFDLNLIDDRHRADVIVINGGAKLRGESVDMFGPSSRRCPDIPLIVMPSSFLLDSDEFIRCFQGRKSPAIVFARERYSYDAITRVERTPEVSCEIDHDMAFALRDAPVLERLRRDAGEDHILVVERFDQECATRPKRPIPSFVKRCIPDVVGRHLKDWRYRRLRRKSGFEQTVLQRVLSEHPQLEDLPVVSQDISRDDFFSFKQFLEMVARAALVVTTRLHVGILAAMLGKRTFLKCGTVSYKKIQGVYEFSLARVPNVKLIE